MLIALKGGHIQGSLLYQCTLNQLKVSLGEGLNSSASPRTLNFPHPNRPLTITSVLRMKLICMNQKISKKTFAVFLP